MLRRPNSGGREFRDHEPVPGVPDADAVVVVSHRQQLAAVAMTERQSPDLGVSALQAQVQLAPGSDVPQQHAAVAAAGGEAVAGVVEGETRHATGWRSPDSTSPTAPSMSTTEWRRDTAGSARGTRSGPKPASSRTGLRATMPDNGCSEGGRNRQLAPTHVPDRHAVGVGHGQSIAGAAEGKVLAVVDAAGDRLLEFVRSACPRSGLRRRCTGCFHGRQRPTNRRWPSRLSVTALTVQAAANASTVRVAVNWPLRSSIPQTVDDPSAAPAATSSGTSADSPRSTLVTGAARLERRAVRRPRSRTPTLRRGCTSRAVSDRLSSRTSRTHRSRLPEVAVAAERQTRRRRGATGDRIEVNPVPPTRACPGGPTARSATPPPARAHRAGQGGKRTGSCAAGARCSPSSTLQVSKVSWAYRRCRE